MDPVSDEHEDWRALQMHPGWLRLLAYTKGQWGVKAYAHRLENAKDLTELAAVKMAFKMLGEIVNYPEDRLKALETKADADHAPATMSRRGSL